MNSSEKFQRDRFVDFVFILRQTQRAYFQKFPDGAPTNDVYGGRLEKGINDLVDLALDWMGLPPDNTVEARSGQDQFCRDFWLEGYGDCVSRIDVEQFVDATLDAVREKSW